MSSLPLVAVLALIAIAFFVVRQTLGTLRTLLALVAHVRDRKLAGLLRPETAEALSAAGIDPNTAHLRGHELPPELREQIAADLRASIGAVFRGDGALARALRTHAEQRVATPASLRDAHAAAAREAQGAFGPTPTRARSPEGAVPPAPYELAEGPGIWLRLLAAGLVVAAAAAWFALR